MRRLDELQRRIQLEAVSRQTVNAIETEKYDLSLPLALRIAKLFTLPVEHIFDMEEP
ncbi:MAG: helix-turn-helix transcriptional regulator [Gemmatimonadales bacterium]